MGGGAAEVGERLPRSCYSQPSACTTIPLLPLPTPAPLSSLPQVLSQGYTPITSLQYCPHHSLLPGEPNL